ncbi:adenylosuccinate synthetase [Opitutia bacterium ISCC 51]|nr:adenylosuccinate synthetase [Opitutae bacterium ISCC 51]QXD28316.1 adenylosuccinate synthetase [Opitutae bacterium ISCC 52]
MATPPFSSRIIADTGISYGDEGKGRLIYEAISELQETTGQDDPVAVVLKVNGGANSGHTAGGLKLNLLPAGVIAKTVPHLAVGAGVVADPRKFIWEAKPLEARGYDVINRLAIDERSMVSDLTHRLLDLAIEYYRENILEETPRGSTGRGISPSFSDETSQWQTYYASFRDTKEAFQKKLAQKCDRAVRIIQHVCQLPEDKWDDLFDTLTKAEVRANQESIESGDFTEDEFDFDQFKGDAPFSINVERLTDVYWEAGQALVAQVTDVREVILQALENEKYIIGEFGQSYWLDKRQGFSPNVTASHSFTPEIFNSAGIPVQPVHTIGVAKAYDTKVGTHLFITQFEENDHLGNFLKKLEFGTSTGRQRMVGWYDAVEKGDALRYGGFQDLMINKLDALSHNNEWSGSLKICVAYENSNGKRVNHVPRDDSYRTELKPIYETYEGWPEDISGVRNFDDLPANAQLYVAGMVKATCDVAYENSSTDEFVNLRYIGVGPDPEQIIRDVPETKELLKLLNQSAGV